MKITKNDRYFIVLVIAVLAIFYAISGKEKTKKVPYNDTHRQFYSLVAAGKSLHEIDALCARCHDGVRIPFPAKHPLKPSAGPMSCHLCHKYDKARMGK